MQDNRRRLKEIRMSHNTGFHGTHETGSSESRTRPGIRAGVSKFFIIFLAFSSVACVFLFSPARGSGASTVFIVRPGEPASGLGHRLQAEGIIRSGFGFQLYSIFTGSAARLKAGTYLAEPGSWTFGIVSMIVQGREYAVKVTIPEGLTAGQTALVLERAGILSADDFLTAVHDQELCEILGISGKSAEGYLFPDTYFFPPNSTGKEIVRRLVTNFFKNAESLLPGFTDSNTRKSLFFDKLILASIIEREYRRTEEAPLISSVFNNRLQSGMRLQSCATVVYVLTEKRKLPHPEIVTLKDLEIQDEYNTYRNSGLPPAPICSPGKVALKAAFFPAHTDFLYFRLIDEKSGKHAFSRTLDEHRLNAVSSVKKSGI